MKIDQTFFINEQEGRSMLKEYANGLTCRAIGRKYHRTHGCVSLFLKKSGVQPKSSFTRSRKYEYDENYFHTIDCHKKAYWLGWLMSDGWVNVAYFNNIVGLSIQIRDIEVLEEFRRDVRSNSPIKIYNSSYRKGGKQTQQCKFTICCKTMIKDVAKYGIIPNKTAVNLGPLNIPEEFIGSFILGEFEGDGHFGFIDGFGKIIIYDSEATCSFIKAYFDKKLDRSVGYVKPDPKAKVYNYIVSKYEDLRAIYSLLYDDRDFDFCLYRKHDVFKKYLTDSSSRKASIIQKKSSQFVGVHFIKQVNKFHANFQYENKKYHVGTFMDEYDAALARDKAVIDMGIQDKLKLNCT